MTSAGFLMDWAAARLGQPISRHVNKPARCRIVKPSSGRWVGTGTGTVVYPHEWLVQEKLGFVTAGASSRWRRRQAGRRRCAENRIRPRHAFFKRALLAAR